VCYLACHPCDTSNAAGLVLLAAEGLSTIQGSSHLTRSLGMGILGIWETYRLSSSHHKQPCFTSSTGGMNKDNQRARTNYSWTLDFGKSMIKSDSETFIFYIRQRDVGITWPNNIPIMLNLAPATICVYVYIYMVGIVGTNKLSVLFVFIRVELMYRLHWWYPSPVLDYTIPIVCWVNSQIHPTFFYVPIKTNISSGNLT
jgi:hypothetical protein